LSGEDVGPHRQQACLIEKIDRNEHKFESDWTETPIDEPYLLF
jgi:hypothetical protein